MRLRLTGLLLGGALLAAGCVTVPPSLAPDPTPEQRAEAARARHLLSIPPDSLSSEQVAFLARYAAEAAGRQPGIEAAALEGQAYGRLYWTALLLSAATSVALLIALLL